MKVDLGDELDIYAQHPDTYLEDINEMFSKNKVIEAFVLLHGLAEYKMNMIWPLSLIKDKGHCKGEVLGL
ncbi:MAG: hypothetical protein ACT4OW_06845 [Nitrososphaerota archaeon]